MPITELSHDELEITIDSQQDISFHDHRVKDLTTALLALDQQESMTRWEADRQVDPGTLELEFNDGRTMEATTAQNSVRVLEFSFSGPFEVNEMRRVLDVIKVVDVLADGVGLRSMTVVFP